MVAPMDNAYSSLYAMQMLQAMALEAGDSLDQRFNLVEYAAIMQVFIARMELGLREIEQGLMAA